MTQCQVTCNLIVVVFVIFARKLLGIRQNLASSPTLIKGSLKINPTMNDKQITRVAAYGLLLREEKMLLCRLSQRVGVNPGSWTLPGGGLDFGEDPEDAVVREFQEETGLIVKVNGLVAVNSLCDSIAGWSPMHSIRIIYNVQYLSGELHYEIDGSTDLCAWHTFDQIQELPLVELAKQGIKHKFI